MTSKTTTTTLVKIAVTMNLSKRLAPTGAKGSLESRQAEGSEPRALAGASLAASLRLAVSPLAELSRYHCARAGFPRDVEVAPRTLPAC